MAECGREDTCKNYNKKCSQCWSNSSIYDLYPCYISEDLVEVVRCKDCELSSEPKSVSRLELYCNNYDVRFCEKEQKLVCGTHFCSYGTPKERSGG